MKAKLHRFAVTAAAALLLGIALFAIFLPKTREDTPEYIENPHFEYVKAEYSLYAEYEPVVCGGDTDLLNITAVCRDNIGSHGSIALVCRAAEGRRFALTANKYTDGGLEYDPGYEYARGVVEKLVDGAWTAVNGIGTDVIWVLTDDPPPFDTVEGEELRRIAFPVYSPGEYRVTCYFRDCLNDSPGEYTTGEELHSVTAYLSVPEASDKRFDIVDLRFGESYPANTGDVNFYLRVNEGSVPYLDHLASTLEKKVGREYVPIEQHTDESRELYSRREYRFSDGVWENKRENVEERAVFYQHGFNFGEKPDGEYRLTLVFCEGSAGGGQRWSVELNLDFGERDGSR